MTKRLFITFTALVGLFLFTLPTTTAQAPEISFGDDLQVALQRGVDDYGAKGMSIAVIVPGHQLWTGFAGESHPENPVTSDMLFSAGSTAKQFLAVLTLQLVDEGLLNLDDPISLWLPEYPNVDSTITIRQLLNHTNGIHNYTENDDYWLAIAEDYHRVWQCEDALEKYVLAPYFDAGTDWHYSNSGYSLLRLILRNVLEEDIQTVLADRLFEPLSLSHTAYVQDEEPPDLVAHGWLDIDGDGAYDDLGGRSVAFDSSICGEIYATPTDLTTWVNALFREQIVVEPPLLDEMLNFIPVTDPNEPLLSGYGLGVVQFAPDLFNGLQIWGHGGNALGYAAGALYLADYGVSIGIMTNTHNGEGMFVLNDILEIILANVEPVDAVDQN